MTLTQNMKKEDFLTAKEAREIAGFTEEEKANEAISLFLKTIKKLATEKKRECRTGYDHRENEDIWIYGGYKKTSLWKLCKNKLENLGYDVSFFFTKKANLLICLH